jgi:hypothetical protein
MTKNPMNANVMEQAREMLWQEYKAAGDAMQVFPKLPNGLTPDAVKATAEWQQAKRKCDAAFAALREFNRKHKPRKKAKER